MANEPGLSETQEKKDQGWVARKTKTGLKFRGLPTRRELKQEVKKVKVESRLHEEESQTDYLTGLLNRRGLLSDVVRMENVLAREYGFSNYTVIVADMIGLKRLNDELGQKGGDQVLKDSANAFKKVASRATDLVARWGGDEFVIVLFNQNPATIDSYILTLLEAQPDLAKFNLGYKYFKNTDPIPEAVESCVNKIDKIKKMGEIDATGRATGNGVIVDLSTANV